MTFISIYAFFCPKKLKVGQIEKDHRLITLSVGSCSSKTLHVLTVPDDTWTVLTKTPTVLTELHP